MQEQQYSYSFKLDRGYVFINYQMGEHNPYKDFWQISRSTHKDKYYFKSLEAAKLFIEINFKVFKNE